MSVFICVSGGQVIGVFKSFDVARRSWNITCSAIGELTFSVTDNKDITHVYSRNSKPSTFMGEIVQAEVLEFADHM